MSRVCFKFYACVCGPDHFVQYTDFFTLSFFAAQLLDFNLILVAQSLLDVLELLVRPNSDEIVTVNHDGYVLLLVVEKAWVGLSLLVASRSERVCILQCPIESCISSTVHTHHEFAASVLVAWARVFLWELDIYGPHGLGVEIRSGHVRVHQASVSSAACGLAEHDPETLAGWSCCIQLRAWPGVELLRDQSAPVVGLCCVAFVDVHPADCDGRLSGLLPRLGDVNFLVNTHLPEILDFVFSGLDHQSWVQWLAADVVVGLHSFAADLVKRSRRALVWR